MHHLCNLPNHQSCVDVQTLQYWHCKWIKTIIFHDKVKARDFRQRNIISLNEKHYNTVNQCPWYKVIKPTFTVIKF